MDLNVAKWKEFRLGELFQFVPTRGVGSTELSDENNIFYIGAKKDENGFVKR